MELSPIQIETSLLETVVETPLNETQQHLRAVLKWWGPAGENWRPGFSSGQTPAGCFVDATWNCGGTFRRPPSRGPLEFADLAAEEMGFECSASCSDSGFHNARKMALRAIELAA